VRQTEEVKAMTVAEIFIALYVGHGVLDWLMQTKRQAYGKLHSEEIRFEHCAIYATGVAIFLVLFGVISTPLQHYIALIYLLLTHFIFDTPIVKIWWCKHIKHEPEPPEWLLIGVDQRFHYLTLYILAQIIIRM
jgi:hypothetical protein